MCVSASWIKLKEKYDIFFLNRKKNRKTRKTPKTLKLLMNLLKCLNKSKCVRFACHTPKCPKKSRRKKKRQHKQFDFFVRKNANEINSIKITKKLETQNDHIKCLRYKIMVLVLNFKNKDKQYDTHTHTNKYTTQATQFSLYWKEMIKLDKKNMKQFKHYPIRLCHTTDLTHTHSHTHTLADT